MIYFTADTHFYHSNILKYCGRPFKNVEEMNETIINNWNSVVSYNDTIYHLGDFSLSSVTCREDIKNRLKGNIVFIKGNHDKSNLTHIESLIFKKSGHRILLVHDPSLASLPMLTLCGHVHNAFKVYNQVSKFPIINVGVDVWDYRLVSFEDISRIYMESFRR